MAVTVGSARIDERGKISGGKAGDQTKKEVSTQNYYVHSKGWRVFRAKDAAKAKKIAECMKAACANNNIGYDQHQRSTLYSYAKKVGFNASKVTTKCETDCSALVRVCCEFAGISGLPAGFRTANMASYLLKTGAFTELKGDKYTKKSTYLGAGDILVTKTSGHTVVVLTNGSKYEGAPVEEKYDLGDRILKNGCEGPDVKQLQKYLLELDYDLGKWGADSDFGDATELAVRAFQKDEKLEVDGEYGPKSHAALTERIASILEDEPDQGADEVRITGGDCFVRTAPNTDGEIIGVAKKGDRLKYGGQTSSEGWHSVKYKNQDAWVSGRYGKLI